MNDELAMRVSSRLGENPGHLARSWNIRHENDVYGIHFISSKSLCKSLLDGIVCVITFGRIGVPGSGIYKTFQCRRAGISGREEDAGNIRADFGTLNLSLRRSILRLGKELHDDHQEQLSESVMNCIRGLNKRAHEEVNTSKSVCQSGAT